MLLCRTTYVLATVFISTLLAREAFSQAPEAEPFPTVSLPRTSRGAEIVTRLGSRLPDVARWYGHNDKEFRDLCHREKGLSADRHGRLFYSCAGPAVPASAAGSSGTVSAAAFPDAQTFQLHSKPGAARVIYLDFDGHTTTGTPWNSSMTGGAAIVTPAYDRDGATSSFSSSELANIQEIWQRVSEDYAPFDVDVTTQDPGVDALRKNSSTDVNYGVRVCIGGSSYTWLGAGAGGVAYIGSFNWNTDSPAFVFPAQLGGGNPKYVADAASHETGHTLGLHHDGAKDDPATTANEAVEYYSGHANWAPIMGSAYSKTVVQFSKGDYPNANNKEDDFALIKGYIPSRADEHGDGITTATLLSGTSLSSAGIISSRTDADLFRFSTSAGAISLSASTATPAPHLNVAISLYDGTGTLLTTSSASTLGATLNTTVPAGTYYAAIDGVGAGSPLTSYDDYGSVGSYTFAGTVVPVGNRPPVAVVSQSAPTSGSGPLTVAFSSAGSSDPDGNITAYDWDFGDGTSSAAANPSHTYSTPGTYNASLVVFDNGGLSSSAHLTITVTAGNQIYVASIIMSANTNFRSTGNTVGGATVTIKDANGALKPGALVTGTWSGAVTGTDSRTTNANGNYFFISPMTPTRPGLTFTFTVTGVSAPGCTYNPSLNAKTSASITVP